MTEDLPKQYDSESSWRRSIGEKLGGSVRRVAHSIGSLRRKAMRSETPRYQVALPPAQIPEGRVVEPYPDSFFYGMLPPGEKAKVDAIRDSFDYTSEPNPKRRSGKLSAESRSLICAGQRQYQDQIHEQRGDLGHRRRAIPPQLGIHFDAHGIAKGSFSDQLSSLEQWLQSGPDPDRTLPNTVTLRNLVDHEGYEYALGAIGPFTDGPFIILGYPDKGISQGGVSAVIVRESINPFLPLLEETYPDVRFIRADELDTVDKPGPLTAMLASQQQ